jgi:hypothetical protein
MELIRTDNYAKGKIIEVIRTYAHKLNEKDSWTFNIKDFDDKLAGYLPTEYWEDAGFYGNDFIVNVYEFPWMTVDISEQGLSF